MADKYSRCIIIGAAEFYGIAGALEKERDLLIAADGGFMHCLKHGFRPDIWVGDADSFDMEALEGFEGEILKLPVEKDATDILVAVKLALEMGIRHFEIYGAFGGRIDHTVANIKILSYIAENGGRGFLYGRAEMLTVIKNSGISFPKEATGNVGVFALGDRCTGVSIRGLKYELADGVINESDSFACSNYFIGVPSCITVDEGKLLIALS